MRAHIILKGRVQGVGFRSFARMKASELGIKGFARNIGEDSVELIGEGEEKKLKKFIEQCKKGPFLAHITEIKVEFREETGEFEDFWEL